MSVIVAALGVVDIEELAACNVGFTFRSLVTSQRTTRVSSVEAYLKSNLYIFQNRWFVSSVL